MLEDTRLESVAIEGGFLLRIEAGEKLPAALVEFCETQGIRAATAEGLGALSDVELGFYDVERKEYNRTTLSGSWELLNLWADIAEYEGTLFAHTHVVLSGPDFVARGGHLFDGTVSVTGEIRVWPIAGPLRRRMHPDFKLHFLDLSAE